MRLRAGELWGEPEPGDGALPPPPGSESSKGDTDWRTWPARAKARLRWRLLTDLNAEDPRPEQLTPGQHALCGSAPDGAPLCAADPSLHVDWQTWLTLAGRGFGKTRTGAEDIAHFAMSWPNVRVALVAQTFADGRDTMVEGESGLLAVIPEEELRGGSRDTAWNRSIGELHLRNGSQLKVYSSESPNKLRGPQHHRAWCDEPASLNDAHRGDIVDTTWNNLMLGLRLPLPECPGFVPQCVVTGTPRNVKLVRDILYENPDARKQDRVPNRTTVVVRGSTYRNLRNLAGAFKDRILRRYEGTTVGRQELHGELLEEVEGALWTQEVIDAARCSEEERPDSMRRIAIGVDPAATSGDAADDTGIVGAGVVRQCPLAQCVGKPKLPHVFVLADRTCHLTPLGWGRRAVDLFHELEADAVVPEVNNGGEMVELTLRTVDSAVPVKPVRATRGKKIRAEPVLALYEQGRVHHVGHLPALEDEMTTWNPEESDDSPDRVDALVWAVTDVAVQARTGTGRGTAGQIAAARILG